MGWRKVTARFRDERVTARDGWQKRDTEISCFLSFYPADLDSFGSTVSQASGRLLILGSLYASWPPTQSFGRNTASLASILRKQHDSFPAGLNR